MWEKIMWTKSKTPAILIVAAAMLALLGTPDRTSQNPKSQAVRQDSSLGNAMIERRRQELAREIETTRKIILRAVELGTQMGLKVDPNKMVVDAEGDVPVKINGVPVPLSLLTEEERREVENVQRIKALMDKAPKR